MGNGIEILIKQEFLYQSKRSATLGIFEAAYLGRLMYMVANMVDIAIIESTSDGEGESEEEIWSDAEDEMLPCYSDTTGHNQHEAGHKNSGSVRHSWKESDPFNTGLP